MKKTAILGLLMLAVAQVSGCGTGHEDEVEQVTESLHAALRDEDGAAACDLLSQDAQRALQDSEGNDCASAILKLGLPPDGRIERVQVFDTAAQVRYDDDVLFLSDFPDGWKVIAAGCDEQAGAPYDCTVQGG